MDVLLYLGRRSKPKVNKLLKQDFKSDIYLWTEWINFRDLFSHDYQDNRIISLSKAIGSTIRRISL